MDENIFLDCIVFPELFLILSILGVLCIGVVFSHKVKSIGKPLVKQLGSVCIGVLGITGLLVIRYWNVDSYSFDGAIAKYNLTHYFSVLILFAALSVFLMSFCYLKNQESLEFEILILFLTSVLGSFIIVSSNDFLTSYVGIELQGLCLYIMAAFKTNSSYSTEAGVKYFILGGLASSFLIFGISLVYGFTGLINFDDLSYYFFNDVQSKGTRVGIYVGLFFILVGLIFKVGGAPFHSWVPDVYEGSPMIVTAFFSIVPKISIFCLLLKMSMTFLFLAELGSQTFFLYSGIISVFVGSVGGLGQTTIKRLLAYSAISQTGFMLFCLSGGSLYSFTSYLTYLTIYVILLVNLFACLVAASSQTDFSNIKYVSNLRYIYKSNSVLAYIMVCTIFSLIGLPPFSGFFSKFALYFSAIEEGLLGPAGVVAGISCISVVYYLRIIRSLAFVRDYRGWMFISNIPRPLAYLIVYTFMFNLMCVLFVQGFIHYLSSFVRFDKDFVLDTFIDVFCELEDPQLFIDMIFLRLL